MVFASARINISHQEENVVRSVKNLATGGLSRRRRTICEGSTVAGSRSLTQGGAAGAAGEVQTPEAQNAEVAQTGLAVDVIRHQATDVVDTLTGAEHHASTRSPPRPPRRARPSAAP